MKKFILTSSFLIFSIFAFAANNTISHCIKAPVIDGKLSDDCWQKCKIFNINKPFRPLLKSQKMADTKVKITFDPKYLYIAFKCKHPVPSCINRDKGGKINTEDRIEIFCDPGTAGKEYYHFTLSSNNNKYQQMVSNGNKSRGWACPWESAAFYTEDGWEAEVAIPMKIFATGGDLKSFKANFARSAFIDGKPLYASWMPVREGFHEPENFGYITGLFNVVEKLCFGEVMDRHGKRVWALQGIFTPPSANNNLLFRASVVFQDKTIPYRKRIIRKRRKQAFILPEVRKCKFKLDTFNSNNKEKIQSVSLIFDPVKMVSVCSGKSYYTNEKYADIIIDSQYLPGKISFVNIKSAAGKYLAEKLPVKNKLVSIPLGKFSLGVNHIELEIFLSQNDSPTSVPVRIIKRKPFPGHEVKTDRVNGIVEIDGKAFFPIAILFSESRKDYDPIMRRLKDHNFNSIVNWNFRKATPARIAAAYNAARKHGLKTIDKAYSYNDGELGARSGSKAFLGNFKRNLPLMVKGVKAIKGGSSLLAYVTFDEPSSRHEVPGKKLYDKINVADGYHPVWCNYNRVPGKLDATDWYDIIGRDIYWKPGEAGSATIARVARESVNMQKKASEIHKPMWTILMLSRAAACRRRIILPREMFCQAYSTVINGAKGILYFSDILIQHVNTWKALKKINAQFAQLAPAILNKTVRQKIEFTPGKEKDPVYNISNIQAKIFKDPESGYIMLLTNIRNFPVETTISVQGMKNAVRIFADNKKHGSKIKETIEACGTRAYKLSGSLKEPLNAAIKMKLIKKSGMFSLKNISRSGRVEKKNILPNPSFEDTTVKNWPDYFVSPTHKYHEIGGTNQTWGTDKSEVFHGKKSMKLILDGKSFIVSYLCPAYGTYTLSAWMKADKQNIEANFFVYGKKFPRFKLSKQWKRYSVVIRSPKRFRRQWNIGIAMQGKGTAWVDAMQLEKGNVLTKFEE